MRADKTTVGIVGVIKEGHLLEVQVELEIQIYMPENSEGHSNLCVRKSSLSSTRSPPIHPPHALVERQRHAAVVRRNSCRPLGSRRCQSRQTSAICHTRFDGQVAGQSQSPIFTMRAHAPPHARAEWTTSRR